MQIEIQIDENQKETKVIIITKQAEESVNELVRRISEERPQVLAGFDRDTVRLLEQNDIIRVYASDGKVYAVTPLGEYILRLRLYELEERLDKGKFARISNSEIVNLCNAGRYDLGRGIVDLSGNGRKSFKANCASWHGMYCPITADRICDAVDAP